MPHENRLMLCPFDKGTAEVERTRWLDEIVYRVVCNSCRVSLQRTKKRDAVDAWNERVKYGKGGRGSP
jgi:hypothetical protein